MKSNLIIVTEVKSEFSTIQTAMFPFGVPRSQAVINHLFLCFMYAILDNRCLSMHNNRVSIERFADIASSLQGQLPWMPFCVYALRADNWMLLAHRP